MFRCRLAGAKVLVALENAIECAMSATLACQVAFGYSLASNSPNQLDFFRPCLGQQVARETRCLSATPCLIISRQQVQFCKQVCDFS